MPSRSRTGAVVVAVALVGCSSGEASPLTSATSSTVAATSSTVITTAAAPTSTTPAPVTTSSRPVPSVEGTWYVAREVTIDRDFFGTDQFAEVRQWDLTCIDDDCGTVELISSRLGVDPAEPVTATWDGHTLGFRDERTIRCFETATSDYTGPEVTQSVQEVVLAASDAGLTVLRGRNDVDETTPVGAPDGCDVSAVGYSTDVVAFVPERVATIDPPVGIYRGGSVALADGEEQSTEIRIATCDAECDVTLFRRVGEEVTETRLTGSAQSGFRGAAAGGGCEHLDVTLHAYDVGEPVVVATFVDTCDAVDRTVTLVGRIVPDPVDALDPLPPPVDLPELDDAGRIEVRETVVSTIQNAIISVGDPASVDAAILATYPTLAISGPLEAADPTRVSLIVSPRVATQPASELNPWFVAFAVTDTSGGCLGGLVIGFPAPRDPLEVTDPGACTAQAVYDAALAG